MAQQIHHLWPASLTEPESFSDHRLAALALLNTGARLTRKAGQFLGQLAVDPTPITEIQSQWLAKLLERNELPAFVGVIAACRSA